MARKMINLTGNKFGRLLVSSEYKRNSRGIVVWKCRCDCGNTVFAYKYDLENGRTKSCGCYSRDIFLKYNRKLPTHKMSYSSFYKIWDAMKQRCLNKNSKSYLDYGGRGILVCDRWLKFENFKDDMYDDYLKHVDDFGKRNTSIDRIDVNGNYEPSNCKWSTNVEQGGNTRKSKWFKAISPSGECFISKNQREFSRSHNLDCRRISERLNRKIIKDYKGWKFEYI